MPWNWKSAFELRRTRPAKARLAITAAVLLVVGAPWLVLSGRTPMGLGAHQPTGLGAVTAAMGVSGRPVLIEQRTRAYAYSMPRNWRAAETANGLDLKGPDGATGVSGSILVGGFGAPDPEQHLRAVLHRWGHATVRFLSSHSIPPQPGPLGQQWLGNEVEVQSQYEGARVHVQATVLVLQASGQYSAIVTAAQGPVDQWSGLKDWLPRVRDSIRIVDGSLATGQKGNALPSGIRQDEMYGRYNAVWVTRRVPRDAISKAEREGMMGYRRLIDPQTGRIFELALESFDPKRGGWINPMRPDELLAETDR